MCERIIDGMLAVQVEIKLGWNRKLDKPNYVKRWAVEHSNTITLFRSLKECEKGVYSLNEYGFIRTIESTPPVRSIKVKPRKIDWLDGELYELTRNFCEVFTRNSRGKMRLPSHLRTLTFQRPMVC